MAKLSEALDYTPYQSTPEDLDFGRRAVNCKFITASQLENALALQKEQVAAGQFKPLPIILLESGQVSPEQLEKLQKAKEFFEVRKKSMLFGTITVENGFAHQADIDRALAQQLEAFQKQMAGRLLGDILVQNGVISVADKEWILNEQQRLEKDVQSEYKAMTADLTNGAVDAKQQFQLTFKAFRKKELQFAEIVVKNGFARQVDVELALKQQADLFRQEQIQKMIGDIMIESETMKPAQRDAVLKLQNRLGEKSAATRVERSLTGIEMMIPEDHLEVYLHTKESLPQWVTPEDIKNFLKARKVVYGILDDAAIAKYLTGIGQTYKFKIAQGKPSVPGRDAEVKYLFKTTAGESSKRQLVNAGDVVAELLQMRTGEPGRDVFGREIPVGTYKEAKLQHGYGTCLSEDRLKVMAEMSGQPKLSIEGILSVFPEQRIDGDLDLKINAGEYGGNLKVTGLIQDDVRLVCGSLNAGEIRGARIEAIGDVIVSGGIIGANITAQGNVQAKFINHCQIETFGNIIVENEIIDSHIACSDTCKVKKGKILSSIIAAKKGLMVIDIGSPVSEPCEVKIGIDENIRRRVNKLDEELVEWNEKLENLQLEEVANLYEQKKIKHEMVNTRQYGDRLAVARKSVKDEMAKVDQRGKKDPYNRLGDSLIKLDAKFESVKAMLLDLSKRRNTLDEKHKTIRLDIGTTQRTIHTLIDRKETYLAWSLKEAGLPVLRAKGQIFEDTILSGEYASIVLKETYQNVHISEVKSAQNDTEDAYTFKIALR